MRTTSRTENLRFTPESGHVRPNAQKWPILADNPENNTCLAKAKLRQFCKVIAGARVQQNGQTGGSAQASGVASPRPGEARRCTGGKADMTFCDANVRF